MSVEDTLVQIATELNTQLPILLENNSASYGYKIEAQEAAAKATAQALLASEYAQDLAYNVDTAQELRDLFSCTDRSAVVRTLGALTKGDGGGGIWYWDETSTANDNLGTVLLPTGWAGAGRWVRHIESQRYSPRWFGVVADGNTDDREPIQACIEAAHRDGGGTILLPDNMATGGGHWVYSNMRLIGETPYARVSLIGDGYGLGNLFINLDGVMPLEVPQELGSYEPINDRLAYGWVHYTNYACEDVSQGDTTLTFTEAHPFSDGDVILLRSVDMFDGGPTQHYPILVEMVELASVSGLVCTLREPISIDITGVLATVANQYTGEGSMLHDVSFESLNLFATAACIRLRACYRATFKDLILKSNRVPLPSNCIQRASFENITLFCGSDGIPGRSIELKTGTANIYVRDITIYAHPDYIGYLVEFGEGARSCSAKGIKFFKPVSTTKMTSLFRPGRNGGDIQVEDVYAEIDEVGEIVGIGPGFIQNKNSVLRNFIVNGNSADFGVVFYAPTAAQEFMQDNVVIDGIKFNGEILIAGYNFSGDHHNAAVTNCELIGPVQLVAGWSRDNLPRMSHCAHGGPRGGDLDFSGFQMPGCRNLAYYGQRRVTGYVGNVEAATKELITIEIPAGSGVLWKNDRWEFKSLVWLRDNVTGFTVTASDGTNSVAAGPYTVGGAGLAGFADVLFVITYESFTRHKMLLRILCPDGSALGDSLDVDFNDLNVYGATVSITLSTTVGVAEVSAAELKVLLWGEGA